MKRDFDLIRPILQTLEGHPHGNAPDLEVEGPTDEEVGYHCHPIVQEGLAEGVDTTHDGSQSPCYMLTTPTPGGHYFVEAARDPDRWTRAKGILAKAKAMTLDALANVPFNLLTQQVSRLLP